MPHYDVGLGGSEGCFLEKSNYKKLAIIIINFYIGNVKMISILISIILALLGISITIYTQEHLREEAQKRPNSILFFLFQYLDKLLLSKSNSQNIFTAKMTIETVSKKEFSNDLLKENFNPLESPKEISYLVFKAKINFLESIETKKNIKKSILLIYTFILLIPSLLITILIHQFIDSVPFVPMLVVTFLLLFLISTIISLILNRNFFGLGLLFRFLITDETNLLFSGQYISITGWYNIYCYIQAEPKFIYKDNNEGIGLYFSYNNGDNLEVISPIIIFPRILLKMISIRNDLPLLAENLNKIIDNMSYVEEVK